MGSKTLEFASGAFFTPTDRQVIEFYLKPKILGDDLKFDVVKKKDVYDPNSNPWQVFDLYDDDSWFDCAGKQSERIRLVFTKLSKIATTTPNSKNKKSRTRDNTSKKAGCGTWTAKAKPEQITDCCGYVIGERRYLVFDIKDTDSDAVVASQFGSFRMHEFCLSGIYEKFDHSRTNVLCKSTHESSMNMVSPHIADVDTTLISNLTKPGVVDNYDPAMVQVTNDDQAAEFYVNVFSSKNMVCPEIADLHTTSTSTLIEPSVVDNDPVVVELTNDQGTEFSVNDDYCLGEDWLAKLWNSLAQEDLAQDTTTIANLGKRKLEEESFCGTKKLCLR
ncbi:hypothetical protein POM88_053152 [Heracleum sosnowskyi]|uniref:NAC domain-containing protein n=1 Tax=Heracleum sosnowskyi TaxID=360622 RepID=A0AAD8GRF1_9APIA|nr:hypothetical protein POM88_053152 [Heracleum sosnowskyi]